MANASILPLASYHVKAMSKGEAACADAQESTFGILETVWLFGTTCRSLAALVSHVVQSMSGQRSGGESPWRRRAARCTTEAPSLVDRCAPINQAGTSMSRCQAVWCRYALTPWRGGSRIVQPGKIWRCPVEGQQNIWRAAFISSNQGASKIRHVHPSSCPLFSRQARGP